MNEKQFQVPTISCAHCVMTIKRELGEMDGVISVEADEVTKTVTVRWEAPAMWGSIKDLLTEINYAPA